LTGGDYERSSIPHKLYDIAGAIQNGTAVGAILKMSGHDGAKIRLYFIVKIVGNLPPYLLAVNFDGRFGQAVPPFSSSVLECGTRTFSRTN
jgi:hypothetical protein